MSSFSALNGAYTSLVAQRLALEVTGQNIANVNTPGYTRQRVGLEAIAGGAQPSMFATTSTHSFGVKVTSIDRLGDIFLETKLRTQASSAARLDAVAETWSLLETNVAEPGENGLAAALDTFFTSWQDVANRPDDAAAKSVLLGNASSLAAGIADGYRAVETQWEATRQQAGALADDINTTAVAVADLNGRIRDAHVAGTNANALIDQRGVLLEGLATMVGGEVRERADGTVDVMVGGNALVRGDDAYAVAIHGSNTLGGLPADADADGGWASHEGPARLVWAASGAPTGATGGRVVGLVESLAPEGPIVTMADTYNSLATTLATEVNALHSSLPGPDGVTRDFFALTPDSVPPALALTVAVTDVEQIATGVADEVDGSLAAQISELGGAREQWSGAVVELGVNTRAAVRRADAAETTRASAEAQLLSQTAVDLDEESVNLVMYQRAYEASARVLTTIDEMLDTLINRTGVVGR